VNVSEEILEIARTQNAAYIEAYQQGYTAGYAAAMKQAASMVREQFTPKDTDKYFYIIKNKNTDAEMGRYETLEKAKKHLEQFPNDYLDRVEVVQPWASQNKPR
jgi:serine protease inhibitor